MLTHPPLHIRTPLLESLPLSGSLGEKVFLKMENLQPTGSFKIRGLGLLCQTGREQGYQRLVSSSGGNAGCAVAYAGKMLQLPTTIFVPETTPETARRRITALGAEVRMTGAVWDESHAHASAFAAQAEALYVPPFDDPVIWRGHATMIAEIAAESGRPDAVVLSVGGGGLLCGVALGLQQQGWGDVPILAVETEGTASLAAAMQAGQLVTLPCIRGEATSLGARTVAAEALAVTRRQPVRSRVVSDAQAIQACLRFAEDHRCLVEAACGASLALAYAGRESLPQFHCVVIIVCGGIGVDLQKIQQWQLQHDAGRK